MKFVKYFVGAVMAVPLCLGLVACGDDDDSGDEPGGGSSANPVENVNPDKVFTSGVPGQVGDMKISTGADGLVSKIDGEYTVATFEYLGKSRAENNFDVLITVTDKQYPDEIEYLRLRLNRNGFVEYCHETYGDPSDSPDEWWFGYNADGRMNYMKRSEGGEVTDIIYNNAGDIVKVTEKDEEGDVDTYTVSYGSQLIDNKGGIMLFDDCFGIDLDEMKYAYYAGMLGKSTAHLPYQLVYEYEEGKDVDTFSWTLANGLPTKLLTKFESSYGGTYEEEEIFVW